MYNIPERKFSYKYQWHHDALNDIGMKYFQAKFMAALTPNKKKV